MEKKEMSMEVRLLIAFVLMGLVLFVSPYIYKPPPAPPAAASDKAAAKTPDPAPAGDKTNPDPVKPVAQSATPVPGQVQAEAEEETIVETDVFRVVFSNRGAVVKSWILKAYKDRAKQPLELVNTRALTRVAAPFAVVLKNQAPPTSNNPAGSSNTASDPNTGLFRVQRSNGNQDLTFEFSNGRIAVTKTFKFDPSNYLADVSSEVTENGVRIPHTLAWRGGFGDSTVANPASDQQTLFYDLTNSKLSKHAVKEAKDAPVSFSGQYSFAGLEDHYFAGVFLPASRVSVELTTFADTIPNQANTDEQRIGAGVGGDGLNRFTFYAGPKDTDLLRKVDPKLEQLIDWGTWFGFIAKPMFLALNWTNDHLTHNFGWAIVVLTIGINTVLFPLRFTSMKSSKKMQALQPQIAALNEKYKGLSMKDPKKADQNAELMDLYKKNGVNPVGGCLPTLLQIPFAIAFYTAIGVAIELRGAGWLWVSDLSQPETLPIRLLPVALVVAQFITQRMTPTPGMDPAQQKMMMFMPLMMGYMFYFVSAGVALYWLTGQFVGMAQQFMLNKLTPTPPPPAPVAVKKKRN